MLLIILGLISLVIIIFWNPVFEHMTNKDIKKVMDFHSQKPGHWDIERSSTSEKDNTKKQSEQILQGPKVPQLDPNSGKSSLDPNAGKSSSVYPQIFGPDSTNAPGHLDSSNGILSNSPPPQYTGFEETTSSNAMPYLNDFSKFMK